MRDLVVRNKIYDALDHGEYDSKFNLTTHDPYICKSAILEYRK